MQLSIFDPNCLTILTTDASDVGLGAVLSQMQNDKEVSIAFASHTLSPAERNYATNHREALAAVWGCEHFEKFLLGRPFKLRTDHTSLTTLLQKTTNSRATSKFTCWFERLSAFDYEAEYKRGAENTVADFLSRLKLESNKSHDIDHQHNEPSIQRLTMSGISWAEVQKSTIHDETLTSVIKHVQGEWPELKGLEQKMRPFFHVRKQLSVTEGVLRRDERVVLPVGQRQSLLQMAHIGHPGVVRMKRKVRERYWWPLLNNQIEDLVRYCHGCQLSAKSTPPSKVPKTKMESPTEPWQRVSIDITGPFDNAPSNKSHVVVLMDLKSGYPEVLLTSTTTTTTIVRWLADMFARYGNPDELLSDNGPQFRSEEFERFLTARNIKHWKTAVYNPQENGQVEVFNRSIKYGVQAFRADHQTWDDGLRELLFNFRATAPRPDTVSPAESFLRRRLRLDHELPRLRKKTEEITGDETVGGEKQLPKTTERPPRNRGPYRVGDRVLTRLPQVLKGHSPWSQPKVVVSVQGNYTYRLDDGQTWNARKMRRYYTPEPCLLESTVPDPAESDAPSTPPLRRSARPTKGRRPPKYSPAPFVGRRK